MPAPFKASLVTPEAIVLEASVVAAQIPAADGLLGILINRSPLLAKLTAGVLRLDPVNEKSQRFLVSSGYAQMKDNELTILTTEAIPAEQVNAQMVAAEQAKLSAVQGTDQVSMEKRTAIQERMHAMRSIMG